MRPRRLPHDRNPLACAGLDRDTLGKIAFETGFCRRASGKIDAPDFLIELCLESVEGTVSYNDLAARIHTRTGVSASRQAYWQRTGEPCVRFFQRVLERVMLSKYSTDGLMALETSRRFGRILLHDSTVIRLPLRLFEAFSGVKNAHAAVCNARIQGVYDLLSGRFVQFSVDPYARNDQIAAHDLSVRSGDLVLRDRGYFNLDLIHTHRRAGVQTVARYTHPTVLIDPQTGDRIDLIERLTRYGTIDADVLVGAEKMVRLRLLAAPVDEETANVRRMKAKKEMKGHAPNRDVLRLMSWTIFLTTIDDPGVGFEEILALYGLRWRIENIFKTWKGNFNFAKLHNVSETQLRVILCARLILITLAYQSLFVPFAARLRRAASRPLSLMKFMRYLSRNLHVLTDLLDPHGPNPLLWQALLRYCTYERRRRPTFTDQLESILPRIPLRPD